MARNGSVSSWSWLGQPQGAGLKSDRASASIPLMKELAYRFELQLGSSPEELCTPASDANGFNRYARVPALEPLALGRNAPRRVHA